MYLRCQITYVRDVINPVEFGVCLYFDFINYKISISVSDVQSENDHRRSSISSDRRNEVTVFKVTIIV